MNANCELPSVPIRLVRVTLLLLRMMINEEKIDNNNFLAIIRAVVDCGEKITEEEFAVSERIELFRLLQQCRICFEVEDLNSPELEYLDPPELENLVQELKELFRGTNIDDCVKSPPC